MAKRIMACVLIIVIMLTVIPAQVIATEIRTDESIENAGVELRQYLKKSEAGFSISVSVPVEKYISEGVTWSEIEEIAFSHTGDPNEGDYLRWRQNGLSREPVVEKNGSDYTITYSNIKYNQFTTAEEEVELDYVISNTLQELELEGKSEYEKVRILYDFVCQNVVYDHDNTTDNGDQTSESFRHAHSAYGALINGKAVCQGYVSLLYRLLLEEGIDNRIVAGGGHGWNIICLDGSYYCADPTWDAGADQYSQFLKGSASFRGDTSHRGYEMYVSPEFVDAYPVSPLDYEDRNQSFLPSDEIESGMCGENTAWTLTGNGTLTISGSGPMRDFVGEKEMPWYDLSGLIKSVVVKEGVTKIGDYAFFNLPDMESVSIADTVTDVGAYAFALCDKLQNITLPNSINNVGDYTFLSCPRLKNVVLSDGMETIPKWMFHLCRGLETVRFPKGLRIIDDYAFYYCDALKSIVLPDKVESVGLMVFYFAFAPEDEIHFALPDSIVEVGDYCFGFSGIKEITWSEGAEKIGDASFYHAYYLTDIQIPESVTEIGSEAFSNCVRLASVDLPNKVEKIGSGAFVGCRSLTSIVIPEGVSKLSNTFEGCTALQSVSLPESLIVLENSVLGLCPITSIELPDSLTKIIGSVFSGCNSMQFLIIPQNVEEIGEFAFVNCSNLEYIRFMGDAPQFADSMFPSFRGVEVICYYPSNNETWTENVMKQYGGSIVWREYGTDATEPTEPSEPSEESTEEPTEPSAEPTEPSEDPTEPSAEPTEPSEEPTEPTVEPTEPSEPDQPDVPDQPTEPEKPDEPEIPVIEFKDVAKDAWYAAPVSWAVARGVTNGIAEGQFGPDQNCTRAQVVTFLWRAAGSPEPASGTNPFTDVDSAAWYGKAVLWAVEKGITNGMTATEFGTDMTCTRAQVATFLWRSQGQPAPASSSNPFTDVDASAWYGKAVLWAVEKGVTNGMGEGTFAPDGTCTRGQIVTFLYRAIV